MTKNNSGYSFFFVLDAARTKPKKTKKTEIRYNKMYNLLQNQKISHLDKEQCNECQLAN